MVSKTDSFIQFIRNEVTTIPNSLNDILTYNDKRFNHRDDVINIISFIDDFLKGDVINRYLVLPGLRDVGKSTILFQIYEYLLKEKNINPQNILYLSGENLNSIFDYSIMDGVNTFLNEFHNANLRSLNEKIFLLIDEAQYDSNWAITGKIIFDSSKNIFMIFSGSSALDFEYNADSARRLLKIPINPLNYSEHLKLKYNFYLEGISQSLLDLIFNKNIDKACELEKKLKNNYPSIPNYDVYEFNNFIKFGGFPSSFYQKNQIMSKKLLDTINRVITIDMVNMGGISQSSLNYTSRLLYFLALQKPGEVSKNSISNYLDCHLNTVNTIIDILEKTHLIFHIEPYSSSPKRGNKPFKYYFATSSLRHALSLNLGIASINPKAYDGVLLENLVASTFNNLKSNIDIFNLYYDSRSKQNVDFILQRGFDKPIPVEVGIGKKTKRQVKDAISKYKADYGIIISNATQNITLEDNIIFLPIETFSFL